MFAERQVGLLPSISFAKGDYAKKMSAQEREAEEVEEDEGERTRHTLP